ncbi:MAG TPA: type II toxin-antitoxin system prevent-host-death family antitoxin [Acetobacteraceae bacterium]|nr:type II toxin-antitoxin system prevent-host-death family antitoxin [Acetobacteraceae bacterium]
MDTYNLEFLFYLKCTDLAELTEISAVEFQRELGRWQDEAMRRPVRITRHGRVRLVLLSVEEFDRLMRRDRVAIRAEDLSQAQAEMIAAAQAPAETKEYDREFEPPTKSR